MNWAQYIGGFVRWLLKGCKTKLKDELEGNLDAEWGGSYLVENIIIGFIAAAIIIFLIVEIFFT